MTLKHPEYASGISDAELVKEALEFCDEELDSFEGMEYDDDSEVCCQRSNTFIRELARRITLLSSPTKCHYAEDLGMPEHRCAVVCVYEQKGYERGLRDAAKIAVEYDETQTLSSPKQIASFIIALALSTPTSQP